MKSNDFDEIAQRYGVNEQVVEYYALRHDRTTAAQICERLSNSMKNFVNSYCQSTHSNILLDAVCQHAELGSFHMTWDACLAAPDSFDDPRKFIAYIAAEKFKVQPAWEYANSFSGYQLTPLLRCLQEESSLAVYAPGQIFSKFLDLQIDLSRYGIEMNEVAQASNLEETVLAYDRLDADAKIKLLHDTWRQEAPYTTIGYALRYFEGQPNTNLAHFTEHFDFRAGNFERNEHLIPELVDMHTRLGLDKSFPFYICIKNDCDSDSKWIIDNYFDNPQAGLRALRFKYHNYTQQEADALTKFPADVEFLTDSDVRAFVRHLMDPQLMLVMNKHQLQLCMQAYNYTKPSGLQDTFLEGFVGALKDNCVQEWADHIIESCRRDFTGGNIYRGVAA